MNDKSIWAYNAIKAISAEYESKDPYEEINEDQCESRIDSILIQLSDDEYDDYLELTMEDEGEYADEQDEPEEEDNNL